MKLSSAASGISSETTAAASGPWTASSAAPDSGPSARSIRTSPSAAASIRA